MLNQAGQCGRVSTTVSHWLCLIPPECRGAHSQLSTGTQFMGQIWPSLGKHESAGRQPQDSGQLLYGQVYFIWRWQGPRSQKRFVIIVVQLRHAGKNYSSWLWPEQFEWCAVINPSKWFYTLETSQHHQYWARIAPATVSLKWTLNPHINWHGYWKMSDVLLAWGSRSQSLLIEAFNLN